MNGASALVARFLRNDSGATAIEYGLLSALIAVGCIAAFTVLGGGLQNIFAYNDNGAGGAIRAAAEAASP